MRRKITLELVQQEFNERGYQLISNEYINNVQKLEYICPVHKNKGIQKITFANFTSGKGCPYCAHRKKKTQEEYEEDLVRKKPNIKVVGKYINLKTKIEHECLICGYHWEVLPDNLLNSNNGCPKCGKRAPLTQEEFIARVTEIDKDIEVKGKYINHITKIQFMCKKCNRMWFAKPNNILAGKGCPYCNFSKGEKSIIKILEDKKIKYFAQYAFDDCKHIHVLPFDFYLPDFNICIEYDGLQHYQPCTFGGISQSQALVNFENEKIRDKIKDDYCQGHNIKLVRIPYFAFQEIPSIITSIIC